MISVNLLVAYMYCPRKVFLQKILQSEEVTRESKLIESIRQDVFSKLTSKFEKVLLKINPSHVSEDIQKLLDKILSDEIRNVIIDNKKSIDRLDISPQLVFQTVKLKFMPDITVRTKIIWEFIKKEEIYGEDLWQKLVPKVKSEYLIESEKLGLKGKIDQIRVYPDRITPVIIKAGRIPKEGLWPGHRMQLSAYMLLLEDKFSNIINEGIVYYIENKEFRTLYINQFMRDDVINTRDMIRKLLSGTELPPIIKNQTKCISCGLKEKCYNPDFIQQKLDIMR